MKQEGVAKDILREGKDGLYDAVVLGKRSSSILEDMITANVGLEVLEKSLECPIWFCRDPEQGAKNVLVCLDGSRVSLKVVDHVGYILEEENHSVTLLHINNNSTVDISRTFEQAETILRSYNFSQDRIHNKIIESNRVVKIILGQVKKQEFGVVAIGWTGRTPKKGLRKWIAGEKCNKLFTEIEHSSLWIIP